MAASAKLDFTGPNILRDLIKSIENYKSINLH